MKRVPNGGSRIHESETCDPLGGRHTIRKASPMFLFGSPRLSWHDWCTISPTELVKSITCECSSGCEMYVGCGHRRGSALTWSWRHSTVSVNCRMSQNPYAHSDFFPLRIRSRSCHGDAAIEPRGSAVDAP